MGPLLFSLFTTALGDVISRFGVKFHQYANGTQVYLAASKDNCSTAALDLASCTDAVYEWLLHNSLAFNSDKSETAVFGTAQCVGALKRSTAVVVAGAPIAFSEYVKSLSFTFYSHLSFDNT